MDKQSLRQTYLERRKALSAEVRARAAEAVCDLFFRHVEVAPGATVAGYWPVRGELDDLPILRALERRGHALALPYLVGEGMPLVFRAWHAAAPMRDNKYGIAEPEAGPALAPDILLVPAVAFDATGHRLGTGKGFYDRTIAHIRRARPVLAVGLAYEEQLCDTLPAEAHDVRMDMIVTDRNVYR